MWLLAREGKSSSDPFAVTRAEQAITDAQMWIWRKKDWWWARRSTWFDVVPTTKVVASSSSGATALYAGHTDLFAKDDWIEVDQETEQETYKIASVTKDAQITTLANLATTHAIGVEVILLPEFDQTATETELTGNEALNSTALEVGDETGFSAGDYVVIAPGTARENFKRIDSTAADTINLTSGLDIACLSGDRVVLVETGKRSYPITTLRNGIMKDFGRLLSIRVDTDGELKPMTRPEYERSYEDDYAGRLSSGDRYLIEGNPPVLRFEQTPSASQIVHVDYLVMPQRYHGVEDILVPPPFQDLLRHVARWYFRDDDDQRIPLGRDENVQTWLAEMMGYGPSAEDAAGYMMDAGREDVLAQILPMRPQDFLDVDGIRIN